MINLFGNKLSGDFKVSVKKLKTMQVHPRHKNDRRSTSVQLKYSLLNSPMGSCNFDFSWGRE